MAKERVCPVGCMSRGASPRGSNLARGFSIPYPRLWTKVPLVLFKDGFIAASGSTPLEFDNVFACLLPLTEVGKTNGKDPFYCHFWNKPETMLYFTHFLLYRLGKHIYLASSLSQKRFYRGYGAHLFDSHIKLKMTESLQKNHCKKIMSTQYF